MPLLLAVTYAEDEQEPSVSLKTAERSLVSRGEATVRHIDPISRHDVQEILYARLVARRLTNKEIATRLDISARTVSTHLSNMFGKLGVDSRGALVDTLREQPGFADNH